MSEEEEKGDPIITNPIKKSKAYGYRKSTILYAQN